eukprot:686387-Pleurochrysis_carterae.AAC.3
MRSVSKEKQLAGTTERKRVREGEKQGKARRGWKTAGKEEGEVEEGGCEEWRVAKVGETEAWKQSGLGGKEGMQEIGGGAGEATI